MPTAENWNCTVLAASLWSDERMRPNGKNHTSAFCSAMRAGMSDGWHVKRRRQSRG